MRRGFTLPERRLLWKAREDLTHVSSVLPKILRCVSWSVPDQRKVAESLLPRWTLLEPEHALQVRVRAPFVACCELGIQRRKGTPPPHTSPVAAVGAEC